MLLIEQVHHTQERNIFFQKIGWHKQFSSKKICFNFVRINSFARHSAPKFNRKLPIYMHFLSGM